MPPTPQLDQAVVQLFDDHRDAGTALAAAWLEQHGDKPELDTIVPSWRGRTSLIACEPDARIGAAGTNSGQLRSMPMYRRPGMPPKDSLPSTFISKAADVLGDTLEGLSGSMIVRMSVDFGLDYDVDVPHAVYPFRSDVPNKRSALRENLLAFSGAQQYAIIKHLCDLDGMKHRAEVKRLRLQLVTRYGSLDAAGDPDQLDEALMEETRHWLDRFPKSLALYEEAMEKRRIGSLTRGLIDDLRLALELLLKEVLGNDRSLENQLSALGDLVQRSGGSRELQNMFVKLIDYYTKYQNTYIKHDDAVVDVEVVIVTELTAAFMRHVVRLDLLVNTE